MKFTFDAGTAPARAVRLHTEAGNCLDIAIGKGDAVFAGQLIDEAIRLERRARELVIASGKAGRGKFH